MARDRWAKTRKNVRNKLVLQTIDDHPEMSYEEIGHLFGISKQRVYQIKNQAQGKKGKK